MKYIVFDFGKVLGYPTSGNWFITNKFLEEINIKNLDISLVTQAINHNKGLVKDDFSIQNMEEEFVMFRRFYSSVLHILGIVDEKLSEELAHDRVYNFENYTLYDDVKTNLERLSKEYKLIMLTDNWPSIIDYLKEKEIYDYFDKVYVSSIYETKKEGGLFFDIMIRDYDMKEKEAMFIDDSEKLLDIASSKGLEVTMMDRDNNKESKYNRITNISELEVIKNGRGIHTRN